MSGRGALYVWCLIVATGVMAERCVSAAMTNALPGEGAPLSQEAAIESTRESMDSSWDYPWYDAEQDRLRRISLPSQWDWWPNLNTNMSRPNLSWFKYVMWSLVVAVFAACVYFAWKYYRARFAEASVPREQQAAPAGREDSARVEDLPFELSATGDNLRELAAYHYQQEKFGAAAMYLFSHQLFELDRQQLIQLRKGKTNRQYLRELLPHARLRKLLEQTMVVFEDSFFGNHRLSRERFESCWRELHEFESLAKVGN